MLIAVLLLPALCVWTGFGLFEIASGRRVELDKPAGLFVFGLIGALCLGWVALALAEVGLFSAPAMAALAVLLGAAGWFVARRRGSRVALAPIESSRREALFLIGLIGLMAVLYLRPHEFIFGGADAGVYVNLGASVARTGSWLVSNPDLAVIPASDYAMLFREHPPNLIPRFYHLPGFYVADGDAGTIIPQFYPLHPVWLAVAHGVGGVTAGLYLTPLWGLLGVLAVYFAAREAFGDMRLAAVTAGLLAITSTQVWFARYPTAEALTQFLLFAGLYAFARYARRGEGWSAAVAGAALGQVMLVRLDAYFLLGVPLAYAVYLRLRRRLDRRFWLFAAPMLLMSLHSIIHAAWQGWPYFYNSFLGGGSAVLPLPSGVLVGGAAVAAALFVVIDRKVAAQPDWAARLRPTWRVALNVAAIGLILIAVYGYFVRPALADPLSASPYWYSSSTIPDVEPFNLVRLGWYLSPLGIALGALGAAWLLRDGLTERTWPMIGVGIFFSLLYVYRTYNNPHHIYVMRRYVPVVFPFASLCVAYVLVRLSDWQGWGRALAIGLALAQVGLLVYTGRVAIRQVDYAGGVEQFRAFAALIPPDAIVLFNDDEPVGTAGIFGTPLAYLDGRTVIDLQEDRLDLDRLDALTGGWLAAGRPVIVVEGPSRVSGLCDRWACRPFGVGRFDMPALEASYEHFPTEIVRWQYALDVYGVDAVP